MFIKPVIALFGFALYFCPFLAVADDMKMCNAKQQENCGRFCQAHQGMKSCIIDITTKSGTCTCEDGVSHTKS